MGGRLLEGPTIGGMAWDLKEELGRFLKPKLIRDFQVKRLGGLHVEYPRRKHSYTTAMRPG